MKQLSGDKTFGCITYSAIDMPCLRTGAMIL